VNPEGGRWCGVTTGCSAAWSAGGPPSAAVDRGQDPAKTASILTLARAYPGLARPRSGNMCGMLRSRWMADE
jgi:hypothetical protein